MQAAQEAREKADANRNKIIQAVQSLEAVVDVVATASEELSSQVEQSSRGADEQSGRVRETATAMRTLRSVCGTVQSRKEFLTFIQVPSAPRAEPLPLAPQYCIMRCSAPMPRGRKCANTRCGASPSRASPRA